jgi:hypothetical protein
MLATKPVADSPAVHLPRVVVSYPAFRAGEAATITGTSLAYQDNLRREGHLDRPARNKNPVYDLFGLGYLQSSRMLRPALGAVRAAQVARLAAYGIAWHVLGCREAFGGDVDKVLRWDPVTFAKIESWKAATALFRSPALSAGDVLEELERIGAPPDGVNWSTQARWLRAAVFRDRKCHIVPAQFVCAWGDGKSFSWEPSIDEAYKRHSSGDARYLGATVTLDQDALGMALIDAAKGKPFVTVKVHER